VDATARDSAGASGFGAGSLAVVVVAVESECRVTVCALTVDFGDDASVSWTVSVVARFEATSDSPASSIADTEELDGCGADDSDGFADGASDDPEFGDDDDPDELD
jgi:hypothetical protein